MKCMRTILVAAGVLMGAFVAYAEVESATGARTFSETSRSIDRRLRESVDALGRLRETAAAEQIPLSRLLSERESELARVRQEFQERSRSLDGRALELANLGREVKGRESEIAYLGNLLGEYVRNFESRLHVAERQHYRDALADARLAAENHGLSEQEVFQAQARLLLVSLDRLEDSLGGSRFHGTAVDPEGAVKQGTFVRVGPTAVFRSHDGEAVGAVEERLGSAEPCLVPFALPADASAAAQLILDSTGRLPFDPTLGNAHKIEATHDTFLTHVRKGGIVMIPIFALAGAALLVAFFKWLSLALIRLPSQKRIHALLRAVSERDEAAARRQAGAMRGPVGRMLQAGVEHLREPRELIEEVMYEQVLATRLALERFLPFIQISAASAPLLGLLGTVTGIINTFKLITVFGSGDVKTLSAGISEALITTEFGLVVAIPSLLIHAFLSRKARAVVNRMEKAAVALLNQAGRTPWGRAPAAATPPAEPCAQDSAGGMMDRRLVRLDRGATVAEALKRLRAAEIDAIFMVDGDGRFLGRVPVRRLVGQAGETDLESLIDASPVIVRVDTKPDEVTRLIRQHNLASVPVLDDSGKLVGRIVRNGHGGLT